MRYIIQFLSLAGFLLLAAPNAYAQELTFYTGSGSAWGSDVTNLSKRDLIKPNRPVGHADIAYDPSRMWHSPGVGPNVWVSFEVTFPYPVNLSAVKAYTQHSGAYHKADEIQVERFNGTSFQFVTRVSSPTAETVVTFPGIQSQRWLFAFRAGSSGAVVVRGMRFFSGDQELFPIRSYATIDFSSTQGFVATAPSILLGNDVANLARRDLIMRNPSAVHAGTTYDSLRMWHSQDVGAGIWVFVEVTFPYAVTLSAAKVYTQHSGAYHKAAGVRIQRFDGTAFTDIVAVSAPTPETLVSFPGAKSQRWKFGFLSGSSGAVVVRGIRFFNNGDQELFPIRSFATGAYSNYESRSDTFLRQGASKLLVAVDGRTEAGHDFIRVYDGYGNLVRELSGLMYSAFVVDSHEVRIEFTSDHSVTDSGAVVSVWEPSEIFSTNGDLYSTSNYENNAFRNRFLFPGWESGTALANLDLVIYGDTYDWDFIRVKDDVWGSVLYEYYGWLDERTAIDTDWVEVLFDSDGSVTRTGATVDLEVVRDIESLDLPAGTYERPERVYVLPMFFIPSDQHGIMPGACSTGTPDQAASDVVMSHLKFAQRKYRRMLYDRENKRDRGTFHIAAVQGQPYVYCSDSPLSYYQDVNTHPYRYVQQLLDNFGCTRFNCPYIFLVNFVSNEYFPGPGGRSFNGGFNRGGGIAQFSLRYTETASNLQSTLLHELGHSFGMPHTRESYGKCSATGCDGDTVTECPSIGGQDLLYTHQCSSSVMSYNPENHTSGLPNAPAQTPGGLIPEEIRDLARNSLVFPDLYFTYETDAERYANFSPNNSGGGPGFQEPVIQAIPGYTLKAPTPSFGPMEIPGHAQQPCQHCRELLRGVSGRCMEFTSNSNNVVLADCRFPLNGVQYWRFEADGSVVSLSGICLNVANGDNVNVAPCTSNYHQRWSLEPDGTLRTHDGGECLEAESESHGANLRIAACDGGQRQQWYRNY